MARARVGILGASGYMGGEAMRVVLQHPELDLAWATSRQPRPAHHCHPELAGTGIQLIHPDDADSCDAVMLALPTQAAASEAARLLESGSRVVDLGAAFRLDDRAIWEEVYGCVHPCWELAEQAVYGISELHESDIRHARLVANPGCFSSAAILGVAPLISEQLIDPARIVVNGLSGTAGAGAALDRAIHHAEIGNNLVPYNAVGHRHTFEIEQELGKLTPDEVCVHFTPVYVPIVRGILDVCSGFAERPIDREQLLELYRSYYAESPFVVLCDDPPDPGAAWQTRPYPWVSSVSGTNRCLIGLDVDTRRNRIVVLSALDSLGKGGARAGVENLNLMLGLERSAGLLELGLHP
jgi:N-acetyl-gamma-glutamyl-phosphate reductase